MIFVAYRKKILQSNIRNDGKSLGTFLIGKQVNKGRALEPFYKILSGVPDQWRFNRHAYGGILDGGGSIIPTACLKYLLKGNGLWTLSVYSLYEVRKSNDGPDKTFNGNQ